MIEQSLSIRVMQEYELPLVYAWRQDEKVMNFLPSSPPDQLTWTKHLHWWRNRDGAYFMINLDDRPIGTCHWRVSGEVGLILGEKDVWGQGHGKTAMALMLKLLPAKTPVFALILDENVASQRLFESLGFTWDGKERGRNKQRTYRKVLP